MNSARSVLLVDDDKDDQFFFNEAVKTISSDIACAFADNGPQGLELLGGYSKPHIVFLDLNMPGMNGFDFLKIMRKDNELSKIPVVIYTTSSRLEDIQTARDHGAQAFITKANDLKSLELKLRTAFDLNFNALKSLYMIA